MRPTNIKLKLAFLIFMFILTLCSCTTGLERIEVLKHKFPNSNISTLKLNNQETWYLVSDSITGRIYLVDFYFKKRIGEVYQIK
jgi:hypothetical protein